MKMTMMIMETSRKPDTYSIELYYSNIPKLAYLIMTSVMEILLLIQLDDDVTLFIFYYCATAI